MNRFQVLGAVSNLVLTDHENFATTMVQIATIAKRTTVVQIERACEELLALGLKHEKHSKPLKTVKYFCATITIQG